mmetsp:Transcript_12633/g.28711  ORF Transcript_12633/g.28711 Transcript_12633/m.28711 type:complete len:80 (+) Transcript_12633:708-947(+)
MQALPDLAKRGLGRSGKKGQRVRRCSPKKLQDVPFLQNADTESWWVQLHGLPKLQKTLLLELWAYTQGLSPEAPLRRRL